MRQIMQTGLVTDYDLNRIGWQQFERLVQALAIAELGNGVRVFGAGKDGGREATFKGSVTFPRGASEPWNGFGVIQAKHLERPSSTTQGWQTFLGNVKDELEKWVSKKQKGLSLDRQPRYFIFATNVALSGTELSGGVDQFETLLADYQKRLGLKGWFAWDYSQLTSLIDNHPQIRQTYLEQIIPGDILARLESLLPSDSMQAGDALALHAAKELTSKQWVRIGDSGYDAGAKLPLSSIGIDLPASATEQMLADSAGRHNRKRLRAAAHILLAGDEICRPDQGGTRGIVLIGGPGQGKSTLAQLIAHTYRAAFLSASSLDRLTPKTREVLELMHARLRATGFPRPQRRRVPLLVVLADFGAYLTRNERGGSLLNYLAEQYTASGQSLTAAGFLKWLSAWPCCLILDGLDEVPSTAARSRVLAAISDFLLETSHENSDVFVVATSRPQGYRGEFDEAVHTTELRLLELTEREALDYTETIVSARQEDDPDLQGQILERLLGAINARLTQRLMTTPLQVTIMAALAERAVDLPTTRYELFDAYYATIYDREIGKSAESRRLRVLRSHVDHLHERAGILLHRRAESAGGSDQLLRTGEVKRVLERRLSSAGFVGSDIRSMVDELLTLASDRLVLLVSPHGRSWGFEVRSIQEYMAARALTEGSDEEVVHRLDVLLRSSHWRNVWLLAAGRLFKSREHLRDELLSLLEHADSFSEDAALSLAGADLAVDLYNDELAADFPATRKAILRRGLQLLGDTSQRMSIELTDAIALAQAEDSTYGDVLNEALEQIAAQSVSNLATRLLSQYRHDRSAFGGLARRMSAGGRTYSKPEERSLESRGFVLSTHLERADAQAVQSQLLIGELETFEPPVRFSGAAEQGARGAHVPKRVLDLLDEPELRLVVARAARALRHNEPDVAQFAVELLREREAAAPVSDPRID
jgi:hypothetical protein